MSENDDIPPYSVVSEDSSPDEPEDIYPLVQQADTDGDQIIVTPEMRREVLGRLAEFELRLSELTVRQQAFVLALLDDPTNLTKAARKAGYADNSGLRSTASQLAINPKVQAAISAGQLLREDRTMVTTERTINELSIIAFSDITNFQINEQGQVETVEGVPAYATRSIQSAEYTRTDIEANDKTITTHKVKIKMWSKTDALRMLALYQKLFSEGGNTTINKIKATKNVWVVGGKEIEF